MFLKVCGITRAEDALHAAAGGATAVGFVLWRKSPRYVTAEQVREIVAVLPADVDTVGLFVDAAEDEIREAVEVSGVRVVQLYDGTAAVAASLGIPVLRPVTLATAAQAATEWPESVTLLLDADDPVRRGGTGTTVDWAQAAAIARRRRLVLAGGLTPWNVAGAIEQVRPFGVDVASGVEVSPGIKDPEKVTAFLANAKAAFGRIDRGSND